MRVLAALLLAMTIIKAAESADLNAPGQKTVTVRSEIQRGMQAMSQVMLPTAMQRHYEAIKSANQQKNTDTDGFLYGLNYMSWHRGWSAASLGITMGQPHIPEVPADRLRDVAMREVPGSDEGGLLEPETEVYLVGLPDQPVGLRPLP